jgi:hypothetical protein
MNLEKLLDNPKFTFLTYIYAESKILLTHSIESEPDFPPALMMNQNKTFKKMITIYYTEKLPSRIEIDYRYLKQKYYLVLDPNSKISILHHPGIFFDHKSPLKHIAFYGPYVIQKIEDYE